MAWNKRREHFICKGPNQCAHPELLTGTLTLPLWYPSPIVRTAPSPKQPEVLTLQVFEPRNFVVAPDKQVSSVIWGWGWYFGDADYCAATCCPSLACPLPCSAPCFTCLALLSLLVSSQCACQQRPCQNSRRCCSPPFKCFYRCSQRGGGGGGRGGGAYLWAKLQDGQKPSCQGT